MEYRLITRWGITEEVNEQHFWTYGDADMVCDYLARAAENGANVSWVFQGKQKSGQIVTFESYGNVGDWENLTWEG